MRCVLEGRLPTSLKPAATREVAVASPAEEKLRQLVQAIYRFERQRDTAEGKLRWAQALNDYSAEMRRRVERDLTARRALDFLQRKARQKSAREGRPLLPRRDDFLPTVLAVLPLGYRTPPARSRKAEISKEERFAAGLREIAKRARHDFNRAWGIVKHDYFAPRELRGAQTQIEDWRIFRAASLELQELPDLLEEYASCVEKRANLLRECANREPTETQWRQDAEERFVRWVKEVTGSFYREKVADVLEALWPLSPDREKGRKAETLRKRAYRLRKSHGS